MNKIDDAIDEKRTSRSVAEEDKSLWRLKNKKYKSKLISKDTWNQNRVEHERVEWYKGIWFNHATPKFSFIYWLAIHNRLSTGDRMLQQNAGISLECVFNADIPWRDTITYSSLVNSPIKFGPPSHMASSAKAIPQNGTR